MILQELMTGAAAVTPHVVRHGVTPPTQPPTHPHTHRVPGQEDGRDAFPVQPPREGAADATDAADEDTSCHWQRKTGRRAAECVVAGFVQGRPPELRARAFVCAVPACLLPPTNSHPPHPHPLPLTPPRPAPIHATTLV